MAPKRCPLVAATIFIKPNVWLCTLGIRVVVTTCVTAASISVAGRAVPLPDAVKAFLTLIRTKIYRGRAVTSLKFPLPSKPFSSKAAVRDIHRTRINASPIRATSAA